MVPWLKPLVQIAVVTFLAVVTVGVLGGRGEVAEPVPAGSPSQRAGTLSGGASPPPTQLIAGVHLGSEFPSTLKRPPTGDKAQSKLWFNDGTWWGVLIDTSADGFKLHRLDEDTQTWIDSGLLIDERADARADALWDGTHLYVVSGGSTALADDSVRLMRYSYDSASMSYALDSEFPVLLTEFGVRSLMVTKDTTGVVWVSYSLNGQVWLNHSLEEDHSWEAPTLLPGGATSAAADASIIVAYGDRIGVVWSSEAHGGIYFASHTDGDPADAWSPTTTLVEGASVADDHMSARGLDGPQGATLFIMVKTSLDVLPEGDADDAQMLLLELRPDGELGSHTYGRLEDRHTRPLLLIDEDKRDLYMFAVSPFGAGSVYYKRTPADEIVIAQGRGAPFLRLPERPQITSPTSTKQNLSYDTGLVLLAADEETNHYLHGRLSFAEQSSP